MQRQLSNNLHTIHIILAMVGAGFAIGFSQPLLEVLLEKFHFDDWHIAALGLVQSGGFLTMAPILPSLLRRINQHIILLAGLLVTAGVLLIVPLIDKSVWLFLLRFIGGMGHATVLIVGATTVNALAEEKHRGVIIGIFAAGFFGAEGLSPTLLSVLPYRPETLVVFIDVVLGISAIPLLVYKFPVNAFRSKINIEKSYILLAVPVIFILAIVHSYNTAAFETVFSVYAEQIGFDSQAASLLTSTILMGGVMLVGLIGIFLDRWGKHTILFGATAVIMLAYSLLWWEQPHIQYAWPFMFLLGGAVLGVYVEGMNVLGRRFKGADLAGAMTGFIIVGTLGSVLSSLFLGFTMDEWGAAAMPLVLLVSNGIFFSAYLWLRIYIYRKNQAKS